MIILKHDRPHPRNYPQTPPDHRHTEKHLSLVIGACCTQQSRASSINRCAPEIWHWPLTLTHDIDLDLWPWPQPLTLTLKQANSHVKTQFWAFDLDLWPTTLTYIASLAKVKVELHAKDEGRRSNGSTMRVQTNGQADGRYQFYNLPAMRSQPIRIHSYWLWSLVMRWGHVQNIIKICPVVFSWA